MKYLVLPLILVLSSCSNIEPQSCLICPACAVAGPEVAVELEKVCDEKTCPNTIDWLNRHAKVCDILENRID